MDKASIAYFIATFVLSLLQINRSLGQANKTQEIYLVARADDMGATHAFNEASILCYRKGIVRTVELLVPGPWFIEAVKMIKENPGLDVGVHLCLTSEWENCKWRPLTCSPSLTDENGHFYPSTSQSKDFPANTGFIEAKPKLSEIETELRAQIEMALKHLPNITHLSSHMGAATCMPEFKAITEKLAREYNLKMNISNMNPLINFSGVKSEREREKILLAALESAAPGFWHMVEHPALDDAETNSLSHIGYTDVAKDRFSITTLLTSPRVLEVIRRRNIKLISYAEANKLMNNQ